MNSLAPSEFILNHNGSIYHLNLLPENLADTVILVGDPDRVERVSKHFDKIEFSLRKREFVTHTGTYRGKRISVVSTGIGTDNIDIVLNELDALVNIDFSSRTVKKELRSLDIVRIGTSGAIQGDIPVDSFLRGDMGLGFDSLLHYYQYDNQEHRELEEALAAHLQLSPKHSVPYFVSGSSELASLFTGSEVIGGMTGTNVGFYGPQGRVLRLRLQDPDLNRKIESFNFKGQKITNLEMETAGIYGLAQLLGHRALSMNAIVANRITGEFSSDPKKTVDRLIEFTLEKLTTADPESHSPQ